MPNQEELEKMRGFMDVIATLKQKLEMNEAQKSTAIFRSPEDAGSPQTKRLEEIPTQEPEISAAFSRLTGHIEALRGAVCTLEKRLDPLCAPPCPKDKNNAQVVAHESAFGAAITEQANKVAGLCETIRDLDLRLRV